jgi:hypothetical protein
MEISPGYHPRNQVKMMHTPAGVVDSFRLSTTPAGVDRLLLQVPGVVPPANFQKPSGFPRRSALIFGVDFDAPQGGAPRGMKIFVHHSR